MQDLQRAFELFQQGRFEQSEAAMLDLAAQYENNPRFWFLLGAARHRLGKHSAALDAIDKSLSLDPAQIQAQSARAQILFESGRQADALDAYRLALDAAPDDPRLLVNAAIVLEALDEPVQALETYGRALEQAPDFRDARLNRAVLYNRLERRELAFADYDYLLERQPDDVELLANRADLLQAEGRLGEAERDARRALALEPAHTRARFALCFALAASARVDEARAEYERMLETDIEGVLACFRRLGQDFAPDRLDFRLVWFWAAFKRQEICNWNDLEQLVVALDEFGDSELMDGLNLLHMQFAMQSLPVRPQTRLKIARKASRQIESRTSGRLPLVEAKPRSDSRIHIAYFGSNFRAHPNAYLTRRLYGLHDRERFFVSAYTLSDGDGSEVMEEIVANCDAFVRMTGSSPQEVAQRIRDDEVQILIALAVYSSGGHPDVLVHRPAPVIASYLGNDMTTGADFVDYRISDRVVMETDRDNWHERIVTLPGCYFPYNDAEAIDHSNFSRAEEGLPEDGFVFCSFNNNFKIEPVVFDSWCSILQRVPNSVLWLMINSLSAQKNLMAEAEKRGVARERLVFCGRVAHARHLGRHRLADLFLDTFWCNAGTTAIESLWTGLPIVTCRGQTTTARIGASALLAAGLPELITDSIADYEALAVELATNPDKLRAIREKLERNRPRCSLFDSRASTRKLEAAYEKMWQRYRQGLAPADIDIVDGDLA